MTVLFLLGGAREPCASLIVPLSPGEIAQETRLARQCSTPPSARTAGNLSYFISSRSLLLSSVQLTPSIAARHTSMNAQTHHRFSRLRMAPTSYLLPRGQTSRRCQTSAASSP